MKKYFLSLVLGMLFFGTSPAQAALQRSHLTLDPKFLSEVLALFPEGQEIAPSLLDFQVSPHLHLHQEAEVSVTFIEENAELQNSFGYFLYQDLNDDGVISEGEILKKEIFFENASKQDSGGELQSGDTVNLGKFPVGTRMGFFLVADGRRKPGDTYYTLDTLNPDGYRHLAMIATAERQDVVLGIEDLPLEHSDRDFNDLLFTFTTNPKSALEDVITDGHIPGSTPKPSMEAIDSAPSAPPAIVESGLPPTTPPLLEGSGQGCQLQAITPKETVQRYYFFFHWLLLALGYAHWRNRRTRRAPSTTAPADKSPERSSPPCRWDARD